jgi:carbon monoxide dehydrogenase subunit G
MHVEVSQQVDKPAEDIWRFIATNHLANHPKWDPGITKLEQRGSGPLGVGSKLDLVRKDMGRESPMELEFTGWNPNERMAFDVDGKQMQMKAHMDLNSLTPTSTQLTVAVDVEGKGFAKVMMPMMGGRMKKQITSSLGYIKSAVESG